MLRNALSRRQFMAFSAAGLAALELGRVAWGAQTKDVKPKLEGGLAWYDVRDWGVEGRGWLQTERCFDRLPAKAKGLVRDAVWGLSRHSAGMAVRFETHATEIHARYELLSPNLAMPHMPATGVSGLDLYGQEAKGQWRWIGVTRPTSARIQVKLASGIAPGRRAYMIYLPLYNGVNSLEIGVAQQAALKPLAPRPKPMLFYGTSITHGGCASRPGMAYPAILGRRLDRPVINLGFSGNGRMEAELGALMAELDASLYVIDCLPNMDAAAVSQRAEPLVRQLRKARPQAPIVLVEDRPFSNTPLVPAHRQQHAASRAALRAAYDRLVASGVKGLAYVEGEHLLGDDGEATVDGSHPSDLGMMRMAEVLGPVLRKLMKDER